MSKIKKLAVCLTALIIILSVSVFSVSADTPTNLQVANVTKSDIGVLPDNYESVNFKVLNASWYRLSGAFIGGSSVNKVSDGRFRFTDTHAAYSGDIELRIQIEVPLDYLEKPYNYFFQIYNASNDSKGFIDLTHSSTVKYSYASDYQEMYFVKYFNLYDDQYDTNRLWGYQVDNDGIILKRNIISFSFYISLDDVSQQNLCLELFLGGAEYSRNNPSSPGYEKPNTDKFNELENLENQLTEDSQQQSNEEINKVNDSLLGSLQRYTSGFSAVGALFLNLALKVVDIQALIYISLAIGVVPLIVGLTVNGLRSSDRRSMNDKLNSAYRDGYRSGYTKGHDK